MADQSSNTQIHATILQAGQGLFKGEAGTTRGNVDDVTILQAGQGLFKVVSDQGQFRPASPATILQAGQGLFKA